MNGLSRRGFCVLLVALVAFMSLFFTGCASDEEKFISMSEEVKKLHEEFNAIDKKFKGFGSDGTKEGMLESFRNLDKDISEHEKIAEEMEACVKKIKEKVDKIEPLSKKNLKLKEEFRKMVILDYEAPLGHLNYRRGQIQQEKDIKTDPKSLYNRSKATGFTDVPGHFFTKKELEPRKKK